MAGYSGTPLVNKIGIKPGHRVLLVNAPKDFATTLGELPPDAKLAARNKPFDVAIVFVTSAPELVERLPELRGIIEQNGMVWTAWPKKSSGVKTDLVEDKVRDIGLKSGLVDIKVCAIDDTWSGLKFVIRVADRQKTGTNSAKKNRAAAK